LLHNEFLACIYEQYIYGITHITTHLFDHFLFHKHSSQSLMDDWQLKAVTVVRLERLRFNTTTKCRLEQFT